MLLVDETISFDWLCTIWYISCETKAWNGWNFPLNFGLSARAKTIQERLHLVERQISFEFPALFHTPKRAVKNGGNFKVNLLIDQMVSFLICLCSSENEKSMVCIEKIMTVGTWLYFERKYNYYECYEAPRQCHFFRARFCHFVI